jgi:hypothetical protein
LLVTMIAGNRAQLLEAVYFQMCPACQFPPPLQSHPRYLRLADGDILYSPPAEMRRSCSPPAILRGLDCRLHFSFRTRTRERGEQVWSPFIGFTLSREQAVGIFFLFSFSFINVLLKTKIGLGTRPSISSAQIRTTNFTSTFPNSGLSRVLT